MNNDLMISQFNERCKLTTGAIVHKTFAIPELLEMVLLNLKVRTLLVAQCLNRRFFEAIRDSHRLQQKMALRKTANPYFSTILVEHLSAHRGNLFYHLDVSGTGREGGYKKMFHPENPPVVEMDFTIYFSERPLPSIGSRIRRMLVCEPIITEMSVQPSCCAPWKRTDFFQIINRSGVTFGDIHDAIERVLKGHRLCLEGPSRRDSGGYLTALHATIAVRPDDPTARRTLDEWKARAAGKGQRIGTSMSGRSVEDGPETEELRPESEDESSETVHAYEDAGRAKVVKKLCF